MGQPIERCQIARKCGVRVLALRCNICPAQTSFAPGLPPLRGRVAQFEQVERNALIELGQGKGGTP